MEKKVLYNLLRMNWLHDQDTEVEPWQVADYRSYPEEKIHEEIAALLGQTIDHSVLYQQCQSVETPEEWAENLYEESELTPKEQDHLYLLLFELWRRWAPEKLTHSIFCDELDYQIFLYDEFDVSAAESIQDALARLQMVLDENVDRGAKPAEAFEWVSSGCANDLTVFLYDYISDQLESQNYAYVEDLLESFEEYLKGNRWMELLQLRFCEHNHPEERDKWLKRNVNRALKEKSLAFNLELLAHLSQNGESEDFKKIFHASTSLIGDEEEFQDLIAISADFFRYHDCDEKEQLLCALLEKRQNRSLNSPIKQGDKDLTLLLSLF